ncbi:MAG TPA: LA2681 family HEPN domain-containing protein [Thermoanaerobaculia bacterium]|nr:LA2681 family HEPN domain-containing protein [Thermoanaerobaculia bacterium]
MISSRYDELLAVPSLRDWIPPDALQFLGTLIDAAHARRDQAGAERAIALASDLSIDDWTSLQRAVYSYYMSNAWADLRNRKAKTLDDRWEWVSPEFERSLIFLRNAWNESAFQQLPNEIQSQILTNLGNQVSTIGRYIEAFEFWDAALEATPSFPMALANRGYGRFLYGRDQYDTGHKELFLRAAFRDLAESCDRIPYPDAQEFFTSLRLSIARAFPPGSLEHEVKLREFRLGRSKTEIAYRSWALKHRLFLNPMNDLVEESVAAADVLLTPGIVAPTSEPPLLLGFFSQIKQEYTSARYLLYEGIHRRVPRYADRDVKLWNTFDYPSYGTNVEFVKLSYRTLFSIFDKVAFFLNRYFDLQIRENRVNFRSLWHESERTDKSLKPVFRRQPNLPLRGLYWISRDLDASGDRSLRTDADELRVMRNHLEHKYLKVHEPEWVLAKGDPLRTDSLAYSIDRAVLEQRALRLAKTARAAIIYLGLAVRTEEEYRRERRGGADVPGIRLDIYDDRWKT